MASVRSQLESLMNRGKSVRNIEEPWWMPEHRTGKQLSALAESIGTSYDKAVTRAKNAVITGVNMLPQLAGLIRDEGDLTNYENMSKELTKKAGRHTETAPYAPFIAGVAGSLREDYDMYVKTMESAANLFKADEYIDTAEGWDNLDDEIAKMTLDDGKTPKYSGNGTVLYLTEQQDKINSLIGRIKNSSKGAQFRYNKAGNEYTDQEVLEKLEKHEQRIAIAVEAAHGDGIINKDEATLIMTGNLSGYQSTKDNAIDQIETEIKRLNRLEESISKQISKHVGKRGFDLSSIVMEGINSDVNTELGSDFTAPDINTLLEDLSKRQSIVYDEKVKLKRSYRGWQGKEYLQAPKVSESDRKKYEESILSDDGGGGGGDDWDQAKLQGVMDTWSALPESEKKKYSDWTDYAIKVHGAPLQPKQKGKTKTITGTFKAKPKIYNQQPSKTNIDEKKYSNKRPDLFPTLKRSNGKFVFVDGNDLKEWDNKAYHNELKKEVPILNAGYDKYYWDNGWKHMKGGSPLGTVTMSPSEYKKIIAENKDLSKKQREVFLKDMGKGLKWIKKHLLKTGGVPSEGTIIGIK